MTDQYSASDIAIVGMALRVPGARNVGEFWSNLRDGVESIRDLSEEELLAAGESLSRIRQPNYVRRAADLPAMEMFDADFFGLGPRDAAIMDPQHRQFLECVWEAMEDAGRTPDGSDGPVGVFAGVGMGSYFYLNVCSNRQLVDQVGTFLLRHTGNDKDFLSTRASFAFNLRGPSVNVQTACSSSLVAVHMACQSLLSGECEAAIAGGVTIEIPHRRGYLFQEGEILSPDGHCHAFDHRAAGTVFGSGVGVVMLRRLSDALADGDHIHGIIKGSAVNNDGATKATYLAPSVTGQAEAIIEAQGLAGVSADSIGYVECHGTGTYLGDPIEIEALTQAFRQSTDRTGFCRVGSVKTNIGHLDTAAGVVGLIKATLAVKHGEVPPTLGYEKPNPAIDFARSPFIVNDRLTAWPQAGGQRRAAVNSLGVGGTNAHVIVEQPPAVVSGRGETMAPTLFTFAAKSKKALDVAMARLGEHLSGHPDLSLADASFTLHKGRKPFEHRRVIAVRDRAEALALLAEPTSRRAFTHSAIEAPAGSVFLFPGGGAQHPGMARGLYEGDAAFRADIDEGLAALPAEAAVEIRRVWLDRDIDPADAATRFLRPSVQLPAILIVEVAVARFWVRHGVTPRALIGHSMGENAAACVAGVLSLADAVRLVRLRGELMDTIEPGGMLSVPMSAAALLDSLPGELDLASVNAPELCAVSGRNEDLERFRLLLAERGVDASRVPIDIAAHSRMLEAILPRFEAFLRSIVLNAPRIPIVSNLTGSWLSDAEARDPSYWVRHLRSTVQFGHGLGLLAAEADRAYIEVGPGRALSSLVKLQPGITANQVINSLPHADDDTHDHVHLVAALGRAWATGLNVKLAQFWAGTGARRVPLPTYPFQHQHYFIAPEDPQSRQAEGETELIRIPDLARWGYRPSWRQSVPDVDLDAGEDATSFLVFLDDTGLGAGLVDTLRAGGHSVVTVKVGDTFARTSDEAYILCPEDGRAGYAALLSGLAERGGLPANIVHLWLVTEGEGHRPGSTFANRLQEQGFYSLLYLAQAVDEAGGTTKRQVTVVTNGMQRVGNEALPYPAKATILGPAMTIPKEIGNLDVRLIDLQLPARSAAGRNWFSRRPDASADPQQPLRAQLLDDLFAAPASEIVAYRNGRRWSRSYRPLLLADTEAAGVREGGVYLITGGLGDLALVMARQLAERFGARIILTGRTVLPARADWPLLIRTRARGDRLRVAIEQIEALEQAGHSVVYLSGNVANPDDMARVVSAGEAQFGPVNGILHAAGLVDDDLIALKTVDRIEAVLSPKLHGTAVLHQLFDKKALELFVLFSSTSTDTAPAGQVDYVAANAYLNAYADAQSWRSDRRTVAVHWGVWSEVGLAARATAAAGPAKEATSPARGPFFSRWVDDGDHAPVLETEIGPDSHWMLEEHRTASGEPVLPGTSYIEIMAQLAVEYGLGEAFELEDLVFAAPLIVPSGTRKTLRAALQPVTGGWRATIMAGSGSEAFTTHAEALLRVRSDILPTHLDLDGVLARLPEPAVASGAPLRSVQDGRIKFGPRWQVLRMTAFGADEAVAELGLAQPFRSDRESGSLLHVALLDIATGFAMGLAPGFAASQALWVPMSYGRITVHGPLPDDVRSHVRLRTDHDAAGFATFDVTIAALDGRVVFEAEHFVMKRLDKGFVPAVAVPVRSLADGRSLSAAALNLAAQVRQGIPPAEGFELMLRALATGFSQPIISSMDLEALRRRAASVPEPVAAASSGFERPELDSAFVAPRTPAERKLAEFWTELLGVERIGVDDSFFDLGGHSLTAVRLFRMIKKEFAVDLPISVLFEAPTIAACAGLIGTGSDTPEPVAVAGSAPAVDGKLIHLVPMSVGATNGGTPLFICAGMFGNVLNLRQLALHLGQARPVYALQARGLYGGQQPHESFEEAARDYIAEIRTVQPYGPYVLGGFSGGGLIAYEMAQQLRHSGEEVSILVMLDTPFPRECALSMRDRLDMKLQDLRRSGVGFVGEWMRSKREWSASQQQKADALGAEQGAAQFHDLTIEAAFRRALSRYQPKPLAGPVLLMRPRLNVLYRLRDGRRLQEGRIPAEEDNGWTPYIASLQVQEVAGDHNSMVLEPFVRVLAARLSRALAEADRRVEPFRTAAE
jgi:acyl transferase domain-containing protein/thioesterase domain-containing protein/acyl carrier protein